MKQKNNYLFVLSILWYIVIFVIPSMRNFPFADSFLYILVLLLFLNLFFENKFYLNVFATFLLFLIVIGKTLASFGFNFTSHT